MRIKEYFSPTKHAYIIHKTFYRLYAKDRFCTSDKRNRTLIVKIFATPTYGINFSSTTAKVYLNNSLGRHSHIQYVKSEGKIAIHPSVKYQSFYHPTTTKSANVTMILSKHFYFLFFFHFFLFLNHIHGVEFCEHFLKIKKRNNFKLTSKLYRALLISKWAVAKYQITNKNNQFNAWSNKANITERKKRQFTSTRRKNIEFPI